VVFYPYVLPSVKVPPQLKLHANEILLSCKNIIIEVKILITIWSTLQAHITQYACTATVWGDGITLNGAAEKS